MYVMHEMDGLNKGNEPWTNNTDFARKLFEIKATVKRIGQPVYMSPIFFTHHLSGERSTTANSMLYNANGRGVAKSKTNGSPSLNETQPNTGWDTLNWKLPVHAKSWGAVPNVDDSNFPKPHGAVDQTETLIQWNSKLTP